MMSDLAITDPSFRKIAKAIREFLRNEYAHYKTGELSDPPPLRVSAFNGKGPGYYQTAPDGRADWSPELERYIARRESEEKRVGMLSFGFAEMDQALESLSQENPYWHRVLVEVDVGGMRIDEYAKRAAMDLSTAKRHRKRATFHLYRHLRMSPAHARPAAIEVDVIDLPMPLEEA